MDHPSNVASGGLTAALVTLVIIFAGLLQGGDLDETRLKALTGALAIALHLPDCVHLEKRAQDILLESL